MSDLATSAEKTVRPCRAVLHIAAMPCVLVSILALSAANASGQPASALQRGAVERASPFGNTEPAAGATPNWHPVPNSPVAPKLNPAVQFAPVQTRVNPSTNITTPALIVTGVALNLTTAQLAFTGRQMEMTTPTLLLTGLQVEMVTDRLILTGKK
jgi:hypothetical protein